MRIAHILEVSKFTNLILSQFRQFSPVLDFQIFYISSSFGYDRFFDQNDVVILQYKVEDLNKVFQEYDYIIFHNMNTTCHINLLSFCKNNVVWLGWGFDYYALINYELLTDFTKSKIHEIYKSNFLRKIIKKSIFYNNYKVYQRQKLLKEVLKHKNKIRYFIPILETEKLLCDKYFSEKMLYTNFKYSHNYLNESEQLIFTAAIDIMIGNSESIINNHLEIIDLLEDLKIENKKIVMPISYDSDDIYKSYLKEKCKNSNLQFILMEDFLPSEDYFEIISKCGYGIFNTTRQNALGNIALLLSYGCKIFLRKENLLNEFFISEGIKVYQINDISKKELSNPLTFDDQKNNIFQINRLFGKAATYNSTELFLSHLKEHI